MKRLNLDETWRLCKKQWDSVRRSLRRDDSWSVEYLKTQWGERNGYPDEFEDSYASCFFCLWAYKSNASPCNGTDCNCPAKKIDPEFNCMRADIHYGDNPLGFYKEFNRLHKIYLGKKK